MIGIDLCKIDRIKDNEKTINKILSFEEIEILNKITNPQKRLQYIASRFCAKEALFKALNKYLTYIPFKEISVLNKESGAPYIKFRDFGLEISITHEKEYVSAVVIKTK